MEIFDKTMHELAAQTPEKQKETIAGWKNICLCPKCPTHTACAKQAEEKLFCAIGGSFKCITEDKGCLCPECPITRSAGLHHTRFCMKGSEFKQKYLHRIHEAYQQAPFKR
jgi:hypothetical protein